MNHNVLRKWNFPEESFRFMALLYSQHAGFVLHCK